MKVEYETEHRPGSYREYRYNLLTLPPSKAAVQHQPFCCDDMESAWDDHAVIFNEETGKVNITKTNCYPEDSWLDHYPINYCPFCGAKIELMETKRTEFVKKTEKREVTDEIYEPIP